MGTYTDIVDIDAPSSAAAGDLAECIIRVKNIYSYALYIPVTAEADGIPLYISPASPIVQPGATQSYSGSFTMPSRSVVLTVSSWISNYTMELDDEMTKEISLAEVFEGTISRKELGYDGARANIPVYDIPQDLRGLVHIWGRNDTDEAQRMGINWQVLDPDGLVVEQYSAWEAWPYTGAGKEHEFIGGRFDLDKPGTYTLNIALSMNPSDPEIVDTYYGTLCTVEVAVPEPEFAGFGISDYSKK